MDRKFEINYGLLGREIMISENAPEDLNELIRQLTGEYGNMDMYKVLDIVDNPSSRLFVASFGDRGNIVGMTALVIATIPTGRFGLVGDVVVHEDYQKRGIATELMNRLITTAKDLDLEKLDLTSSAKREAAHTLYESLGFERRETNNFRLMI